MLWERAAIAVVSVGLLVNTRSISLLWLLLVLIAALVLARRDVLIGLIRRPAVWAMLGLSAVISLVALNWYLHPPQGGDQAAVVSVSMGAAFTAMLSHTFEYSSAYVGIFGWLDAPSPPFSLIVWTVAIVVLTIGALVWGSGRARWIAAGFGAALVLVPPVTQALIAPQLGIIWQGRYMLAVFLCFLAACGLAIGSTFEERELPSRVKTVLVVALALLSLGHVASFVWTLRRYVVGAKGFIQDMLTHPAWQPPLGWIALTVLLAVWSVGASVLVYRRVTAVPVTA